MMAAYSVRTKFELSIDRKRPSQEGMARPERFELPTTWFEAKYSIQLSYGRVGGEFYQPRRRTANSTTCRASSANWAWSLPSTQWPEVSKMGSAVFMVMPSGVGQPRSA